MRIKRVTFVIVVLLLLAIPISTAFAEPLFDINVGKNETVNNDVIVFDGDEYKKKVNLELLQGQHCRDILLPKVVMIWQRGQHLY